MAHHLYCRALIRRILEGCIVLEKIYKEIVTAALQSLKAKTGLERGYCDLQKQFDTESTGGGG